MNKKKNTSSAKNVSSDNTPYEFVERDVSEEKQGDINYTKLLNITVQEQIPEGDEEAKSQNIIFYCKECESVRATKKIKGKKLQFSCAECGAGSIYLGTELGIQRYFHIKDQS